MITISNIFLFVNFLPVVVFFIGIFGLIFFKKNLIYILIILEIIFLASSLNFILASVFFDDIIGYIAVLFIFAIAASEVSIGLALIILFYRIKNVIFIDSVYFLKT